MLSLGRSWLGVKSACEEEEEACLWLCLGLFLVADIEREIVALHQFRIWEFDNKQSTMYSMSPVHSEMIIPLKRLGKAPT